MSKPRLTGRVVLPGDPGYDEARTNFNLRFDVRPLVIVFCQTTCDVANAVRWARAHDVPVSVRSGRHSYEGFSLGDGIVIDVAELSHVEVDVDNRLGIVGSGMTLGPLYDALWEHGLTVPGGDCPTVGIAGLTLGGGFGMIARALGLTADSLLGVEMVDARGDLVTATQTHHPDLLWACQGGGGGTFGIVTSFTFRLHPVSTVTAYRASWHPARLREVLDAWQRWAPFVDDRLTSLVQLSPAGVDRVTSTGLFLGSRHELASLLDPLFAAAEPGDLEIEESTYIAAMRRYEGFPASSSAWRAHWQAEGSVRFKSSSDYARAPLERAAIATIEDQLAVAPNARALLQLDAYGGAVNRVPVCATAFPHRGGTLFGLQYQAYWSEDAEEAENVRWASGFRAAMAPFVSGEAYVGYPDVAIVDWQRAYFGPNFPRLVAVKTRYDPENVFHHAQSVPPA
jgi:FAD/FMN-containing dehydrogenase